MLLNCVILFSFSIKLDSRNRNFPASWVQHRLFKYSPPVVAPSAGHQSLSPLYLDHHRQLKCNQNCFKAPETQKHLGFKWNYSWQIEFQDCVFWITFTFSAFYCFLINQRTGIFCKKIKMLFYFQPRKLLEI